MAKPLGIDLNRCIGCGVCVVSCKTGALSLARMEQQTVPLKDIERFYEEIIKIG